MEDLVNRKHFRQFAFEILIEVAQVVRTERPNVHRTGLAVGRLSENFVFPFRHHQQHVFFFGFKLLVTPRRRRAKVRVALHLKRQMLNRGHGRTV